MASERSSVRVNLLIVGDVEVGKTCIANQFVVNDTIIEYIPTIGMDLQTKVPIIDGDNVKVFLYDTGGDEKFRAIVHTLYRNANGIVVVFDVTNKESFQNLKYYFDEIEAALNENLRSTILVGNKCDLLEKRQVSTQEAKKFATMKNVEYVEVSAKRQNDVETMMMEFITNVKLKIDTDDFTGMRHTLSMARAPRASKSSSCFLV